MCSGSSDDALATEQLPLLEPYAACWVGRRACANDISGWGVSGMRSLAEGVASHIVTRLSAVSPCMSPICGCIVDRQLSCPSAPSPERRAEAGRLGAGAARGARRSPGPPRRPTGISR